MARMIFTMSTGRCGTKYLATMLDLILGVDARHEPRPSFRQCSYQAQLRPEMASQFWRQIKLPYIESLDTEIYVETSHLFMNGFVAEILDHVVPDIIVLRRPVEQVVASYLKRGSVPGRTRRGIRNLLRPTFRDWDRLSDAELCRWHCEETERSIQDLVPRFRQRGSVVVETELSTIRTRFGIQGLMRGLDLPELDWSRYSRICDQRINK